MCTGINQNHSHPSCLGTNCTHQNCNNSKNHTHVHKSVPRKPTDNKVNEIEDYIHKGLKIQSDQDKTEQVAWLNNVAVILKNLTEKNLTENSSDPTKNFEFEVLSSIFIRISLETYPDQRNKEDKEKEVENHFKSKKDVNEPSNNCSKDYIDLLREHLNLVENKQIVKDVGTNTKSEKLETNNDNCEQRIQLSVSDTLNNYLENPNPLNLSSLENKLKELNINNPYIESYNNNFINEPDSVDLQSNTASYLTPLIVARLIKGLNNDIDIRKINQQSLPDDITYNNDCFSTTGTNFSLNIPERTQPEIAEKGNKRVIYWINEYFFNMIMQEKSNNNWQTCYYDISKHTENIHKVNQNSNSHSEIKNLTGIIKHDGSCGVGVALYTAMWINSDPLPANSDQKTHKNYTYYMDSNTLKYQEKNTEDSQ